MRGKASMAARERRQRKMLRAELERVNEFVEREARLALAMCDERAVGAEPAVVLEAVIEGDRIEIVPLAGGPATRRDRMSTKPAKADAGTIPVDVDHVCQVRWTARLRG